MTVTNREEIANMMKTAERLDAEGHTELAQQMDITIAGLVATAEKEDKEEKAGRAMSGKAKAKFRSLKKAAQSLCDADLDYRGPHKKECRKVEALCEDILEALAEADFE